MNPNEPIRILQVIGSMNRGGAETMIMNLYRNVDRSKVQFDFLLHNTKPGAYDDEIRALGGKLYYIQRFRGYNSLRYYKECCAFFKAHHEIRVVHGHIGSSASIYLTAAKKYGCFTIAHSHNAENRIRNLHDLLYKVFSSNTDKIADQLFGCSTKAGISRYGEAAVSSSKYRNFNNGIELDRYTLNQVAREKIRKEFGISDGAPVIGTVGRLTTQKNPEMMLSIFENITSIDRDARCIWVGTGELKDEISGKIKSKGLEDKVYLTGVRSDVPDILQAMDCFVFPSLWEGLPLTIVEAQAAGLGIVLSDVISHEVEVTDQLIWKSLSDTPESWASACLSVAKHTQENRVNPFEDIRDHGYDAKDTAKWLQDFYCEKAGII